MSPEVASPLGPVGIVLGSPPSQALKIDHQQGLPGACWWSISRCLIYGHDVGAATLAGFGGGGVLCGRDARRQVTSGKLQVSRYFPGQKRTHVLT